MAILTTDLGKVMPLLKGEYNPATPYLMLDVVTKDGNYYLSKLDENEGNAVTNTTWWQLTSREGERQTAEATRGENELARGSAEVLRVTAENTRKENETARGGAELLRGTAETTRGQNETARLAAEELRVTAETGRQTNTATAIQNAEQATSNANTKAGLANDAAILANSKAGIANTAAETATNAAAAVAPSVINNEQVQAETYNVLNARIMALEEIIRNMAFATAIINKVDVVDEFNIHGITNLILKGTTAPSITPDFVGQTYINTTAGTTYTAKGITNSGDWKQTSN